MVFPPWKDETFRFKVDVPNGSILNPCETMEFVWPGFLWQR